MADEPVIFNRDAHERISKTVRTVEGWKTDRTGRHISKYPVPNAVWVKITSAAVGYGKYVGKVVYAPDSEIDPESDMTSTDVGAVDTDEDEILIINADEAGRSTWSLLGSPQVYLGTIRGETEDGTTVVLINESPHALWGKLTTLWAPGNATVTLQPVTNAAGIPFEEPPDPIAAYIVMPFGTIPAYLHGEVDSVFAYEDLGGGTYLLKNPLLTPLPARKWEVIQDVREGEHPQWAADYMRAHNV